MSDRSSPGRARARIWIATEPGTLRALLATLGEAEDAADQGRVFVAGRRQRSAETLVAAGERVEVRAPRASCAVELIERRAGLIVANKPASLATEPDRADGSSSLVERVAQQIGGARGSVHAASRLDVGVSGAVLLATDARARRHLAEQRARGGIARVYLAIAARAPRSTSGSWSWPVTTPRGREAASTAFRVLAVARAGQALLELRPLTGRRHQLRVHAATAGAPLLGDRARAGGARLCDETGAVIELGRVALHALSVSLVDVDGEPWTVQAPWPEELAVLWRRLGGADA